MNYTENSHGAWGYSENTKTNDDGSFTTNISLSLDVDNDLMATDFAEVIKASGIKLDANDAAANNTSLPSFLKRLPSSREDAFFGCEKYISEYLC